MLKSCLAAGVLALLAAPAWAQKDDLAGIDKIYDGAAGACLAAHSNVDIAQELRQAACERELIKTDGIYARRLPVSKHETNVYYMHRAFLQLEIGGAFLRMDKVRSARVCTQSEAAWASLNLIVDSESPSAYQQNYVSMRAGIAKAITQCRKEFATPAGAPPLPPS